MYYKIEIPRFTDGNVYYLPKRVIMVNNQYQMILLMIDTDTVLPPLLIKCCKPLP